MALLEYTLADSPVRKNLLADYFGPLSYKIEGTPGEVHPALQLPSRNPAQTAWLVVRAPDARPIASVEIDGKPWNGFDADKEWVRLLRKSGETIIVVHFH